MLVHALHLTSLCRLNVKEASLHQYHELEVKLAKIGGQR